MIAPEELTANKVYDGYAATYGFDVDTNLPAWLKYDLALKYLKPGDEVLDIGCANGIHMRLLAGKCRHITGIDINEPMLDIARSTLAKDHVGNATLELRSATELGFPDESFDLIYSFSTLTLVSNIARALNEIARVLRPGGIALLDISGRWNLSHIYWSHYYRRHGHFGLRAFGYREALAQIETLRMQVVEGHASGFLDQWRYIPGLHWCKSLDRVFHRSLENDLDYRVSNSPIFFPLANRWYFACRKER